MSNREQFAHFFEQMAHSLRKPMSKFPALLLASVVTEIVHERIYSHVQDTCKGSFGVGYQVATLLATVVTEIFLERIS